MGMEQRGNNTAKGRKAWGKRARINWIMLFCFTPPYGFIKKYFCYNFVFLISNQLVLPLQFVSERMCFFSRKLQH
jgi:hypothetical protein